MKPLLSLLSLFVASSTWADPAHSLPHFGHSHGVHGVRVLGSSSQLFLSHLPLYYAPHDFQGILEVQLDPATQAIYLQDQATHPDEKVYTLVPEAFDWEQLVAAPRPFQGKLFRGHFERGGHLIVSAARIQLVRSIYFRKLDAHLAHPGTWTGIVFGSAQGLFVAHAIAGRPDFDQILKVSAASDSPLLRALESLSAIEINFPTVNADRPLVPAYEAVEARTPQLGSMPTILSIGTEVAIEFEDLAQ